MLQNQLGTEGVPEGMGTEEVPDGMGTEGVPDGTGTGATPLGGATAGPEGIDADADGAFVATPLVGRLTDRVGALGALGAAGT